AAGVGAHRRLGDRLRRRLAEQHFLHPPEGYASRPQHRRLPSSIAPGRDHSALTPVALVRILFSSIREVTMGIVSEARRAANRANAQKSTGPKTAAGKQAVRLNAVKHGLCAASTVLKDEDAAAFDRLHADYARRFAPRDEGERAEVRQMAEA